MYADVKFNQNLFKFINFQNLENNPVVETCHYESLIKISKLGKYFSREVGITVYIGQLKPVA